MARITEQLEAPVTPEVAFDRLADFTTTAAWDPGIAAAERLDDGPIGLGSRFEVRSKLGLATVPLVYEITRYERPDRLVLSTQGLLHRGEDDVRFAPGPDGRTAVTWNARFAVRGPIGRLIDPALAIGFRRVGKAAIAGLERFLHEQAGQRR
jgi:dehydrogenase/reductase SDR family member 12